MMSEKIYIGIDGKRIELKGKELEAFLLDRENQAEQTRLLEANTAAKAEAKASAMIKLAALGLNEEEVKAIIGA
jgi:hypothetical protein